MPISRQSWMVLLILLAGVVALAGCGSGDEPEAAAGPDDSALQACALFTQKDAEAAAGLTVSGTLSSTLNDVQGPNPLQCTFATGSLLEPGILSVEIRPARNAKRAARLHEAGRGTIERLVQGEVEDVSGVGEGAYWAGGQLKQLHVVHGRYQLIITVQPGKNQLAAAKQIASTVIARMRAQAPPAQTS
ncbi:MAG TPA: hypothetical protein VEL74_21035 [Thermoanaerobaculia bacterium]|nr:hypothetical protein [Thermoanaerobaculia bacterium]